MQKAEWVETWINGGSIPIRLASTYKSKERKGIQTPDENLTRKLRGANLDDFSKLIHLGEKVTANIIVGEMAIGNRTVGKNVNYHQAPYEGIVLCFCNKLSKEIALRLEKEACVEILDVDALLNHINNQLGLKGLGKECEYTSTSDRGIFLKSIDDSWQEEYRLFWELQTDVEVEIPPGIASEVKF